MAAKGGRSGVWEDTIPQNGEAEWGSYYLSRAISLNEQTPPWLNWFLTFGLGPAVGRRPQREKHKETCHSHSEPVAPPLGEGLSKGKT